MDYDVAVIGSGFGGSVCACRAAQAGLRVIVLERGRRMSDEAYSDLAVGRSPFLRRGPGDGLVEFHHMPGLRAFTASCVGGGSHLYTGVTVRARREIFDSRWPAALRDGALEPFYDRVEAMIAPRPTPNPPARARAVCDMADRLGGRGVILPVAMDFDHVAHDEFPATLRGHAATWLRGGHSVRKKTLDQTYLAAAESAGAAIRPRCEVTSISASHGRYRLGCRIDAGPGEGKALSAGKVVIAAGTMGTLRLLLTSQADRSLPHLSLALGSNFFTNGDFGALLLWPKCGLEADDGPPVTAWLDWWKEDRLHLMETNHFVGGRVWSFGVMGFDDCPGRISLESGKRGRTKLCHCGRGLLCHCGRARLCHTFDPRRGEPFHAARLKRLRELANACRAKLIYPPSRLALRTPDTIHPLGGGSMADSPSRGVVDSDGQVFGYPGLYIADGSILPTPIGAAPSMTIAALAERVSDHLISHA